MSHSKHQISLFIGQEIKNAAERNFLRQLIDITQAKEEAMIFANFHCAGRQIDFAVITKSTVSVFEIKSSHFPIIGEINGKWKRIAVDGSQINYRNAYQQALDAKNNFRNLMNAFQSVGTFYPNAFVYFPFGIPNNSQITEGDFKVSIQPDLSDFLSKTPANKIAWDFDKWRDFAKLLNLDETTVEVELASDLFRKELQIVQSYNSAFAIEYSNDGDIWLPESEEQFSGFLQAAHESTGLFISGPSGCGKTLLCKKLACELSESGEPCIYLSGKNFSGEWNNSLKSEIGLLTGNGLSNLIKSFSYCCQNFWLIFDGLNELSSTDLELVRRGLKALSQRWGTKIIVTSQNAAPSQLDHLKPISVSVPSKTLKEKIIGQYNTMEPTDITTLVDAVNTGYECAIIGEIGRDFKSDMVRPVLIDCFIRKRLSENGSTGARALRILGIGLMKKSTFSIFDHEFDDLMIGGSIDSKITQDLFETGLLSKKSGRVTFSHEILQSSCTALNLASVANDSPNALAELISKGMFSYLASDAIAAIESVSICEQTLKAIETPALYIEAGSGNLGNVANTAAISLIKKASKLVVEEISGAYLSVRADENVKSVQWSHAAPHSWSKPEIARLIAFGLLAKNGVLTAEYLELSNQIDRKCSDELIRVKDQLDGVKGAKSNTFAMTHLDDWRNFGVKLGFTTIAKSANRQHGFGAKTSLKTPSSFADLSYGQLYFFLENLRSIEGIEENGFIAGQIVEILEHRFRYLPYHVKLEALSSIMWLGDLPEQRENELISILQSTLQTENNILITTEIIEQLKRLGGLNNETEEHRPVVRDQIEEVLRGNNTSKNEKAELALSIYTSMFDHPFNGAYCEEVYSLSQPDKENLYRWAVQDEGLYREMSLRYLVQEIAEFNNEEDSKLLARFTLLPSPESSTPQDTMSAFCKATRFFARHRISLPHIEPSSEGERCLSILRELVYSIERSEDDSKEYFRDFHPLKIEQVLGCMGQIQETLRDPWGEPQETIFSKIDLIELFPNECLDFSRKFIENNAPAVCYRGDKFMADRGNQFAFTTISRLGDRSDLDRLRASIKEPEWSSLAVNTIKLLDK